MEFDKSRVYTTVNAEELKAGSTVICADNLATLKFKVADDYDRVTFLAIRPDDSMFRFQVSTPEPYALAYLVEEPEEKKLQWTDLKIGDVIHNGDRVRMVTGIDTYKTVCCHILACDTWIDDRELESWEKVEDEKH